MLVVAWLANRGEGGGESGLDRLVARLDQQAREHFDMAWDSTYVPVEIVEYLAGPDAAAWRFSRRLLAALNTTDNVFLRRVPARHFLALVEKFTDAADEPAPEDADIARFIGRYLEQRGCAEEAPDLPTALEALRGLVG